jgi:hypothetical protein
MPLYIEQGATFATWFTWCRQSDPPTNPPTAGAAYDLTGAVATMQIRTPSEDGAGAEYRLPALVSAASDGTDPMIILGTTAVPGVFDPTNGRVDIVFAAATTDLLNVTAALYDLEVLFPDGDVRRVMQGRVSIDLNITRAGTP